MTSRERQRRAEGRIEWRGRQTFRVRVHNGFDPVTGKRRYLYATGRGNQKAAEKALRDLLTKRDSGLDLQPERVTTSQWLTRWLEGRIADGALSPRVTTNYRGILTQHVAPSVGHVRLQELRTDHLLDFKTALLEGKLAPATVRKVLGLVKQGLEAAVIAGLLARNPAAAVPLPSPQQGRTERRALTEEDLRMILHAAEGTAYATLIRFAVATGLRQGEMLGLRWQDLDLGARTLQIRQTVQHVKGVGFQTLPPKTKNSRRTVELSAALAAMLKLHRKAQDMERARLGEAWHANDLVFPGPDGRPQWQKGLLRGYRDLLDASGIADPATVNWHTLRHTAASLWIKAGVDVFTVSRRLGHSSAAFTMDTYAHLLRGQQQAAAEALDHLIALP